MVFKWEEKEVKLKNLKISADRYHKVSYRDQRGSKIPRRNKGTKRGSSQNKERETSPKQGKQVSSKLHRCRIFPSTCGLSKKNPTRPNIAEDKTHESGAKHNFHLKTNRFGQNKREKSKLNIASHAIA